MTRFTTALLLAFALAAGGCVALGFKFGPGYATTDRSLFSEAPHVEHRSTGYFLTWKQGSKPHFYKPSYQTRDGKLVFSLVELASTGNLAGRHRELKIEGADNLAALQRGGAFWWQRDPGSADRMVPLDIVEK